MTEISEAAQKAVDDIACITFLQFDHRGAHVGIERIASVIQRAIDEELTRRLNPSNALDYSMDIDVLHKRLADLEAKLAEAREKLEHMRRFLAQSPEGYSAYTHWEIDEGDKRAARAAREEGE